MIKLNNELKILSIDEVLTQQFLCEMKDFLRVDLEDDDNEIMGLIIAAEVYLKNAGCIVDYNNFLFVLAIKLLVSHWYENRMIVSSVGVKSNLSYSLESIITQLKYAYGDELI